MTSSEKQYWFPAKRYGWGWGFPITWQGWVVFVGYIGALLAGACFVLPPYGAPMFATYAAVLTSVLIAICWVKGERPHWRWGNE